MGSSLPYIKPSSDGVALITVCVVFATLAVVSVALRIWARYLMRQSWGLDDYLALSSMLVYVVEVPIFICTVIYGGSGSDEAAVVVQSPGAMTYYLKVPSSSKVRALVLTMANFVDCEAYVRQPVHVWLFGFSHQIKFVGLLLENISDTVRPSRGICAELLLLGMVHCYHGKHQPHLLLSYQRA